MNVLYSPHDITVVVRRRVQPFKSFSGKRILIIDDSADYCDLLATFLNGLGATTTTCLSYHAFVRAAKASVFDVVIAEPLVKTGSMSDLLSEIYRLTGGPIVVVTASDAGRNPNSKLYPAAEAWLSKPTDLIRLASVISSVLRSGRTKVI